MVPIRQNLVPSSKYSIKCPYAMTPTRIVVHNTANDASAASEISYMISNDNEVSFHYAVDDVEIVQGILESRNAWHAGDGNGPGNREGIAIEICYSKSGGNKFDQAEKNAAEFIASILSRKGWDISKVTKHQDYSGKYCPARTLDYGWQRFLNMVQSYLSFTCDTHSTVKIQLGKKYQARITCAAYPNVVAGTGGIVSISLASQSGNDYFFAFTGVKVGSTGIYINGSPSPVFICEVI
jgi:N-acetylmuramoyl-L-alanine amidase CwlA